MTQSMLELKIPAPITTFGAWITIEGELPTYASTGLVDPTWTSGGLSYWGGDNEVNAGAWDSGTAYATDDVVNYSGYIYEAPSPGLSAGTAPFPGDEVGGNDAAFLVSYSLVGGRERFKVSSTLTCTGVSLYGYATPGGIAHGYRAGIIDDDPENRHVGATTFKYDDYIKLAEGTFQGPNGSSGWQHIQFDRPLKLEAATWYQVLHAGDAATASAIQYNATGDAASPTAPVSVVGASYSGISGYDSDIIGPNASVRLIFKLWTTPWIYLPDAIQALDRDARFFVYVGPSGLSFSSITDDMLTEVSLPDPSFSGARQTFRVKDVVPALAATQQSVYVKYVPTTIPADSPHGVAIYNVTAEAYTPGYELGPHSTSASFY